MINIKGQQKAKRALKIAAAGGHNLLLFGPPGSGKTFLAKALPSILPPLTTEEKLEIIKIYSSIGLLSPNPLAVGRPFRAPHHSSSGTAITGGGSFPRPGEISLAHRGILFLDEFPEFSRDAIENLRQPLEEGKIIISRASLSISFPARFLLIAAMNPCPCGYSGDKEKICQCDNRQISNYKRRVSGPILDRFDLHVEMPRLSVKELNSGDNGESSLSAKQEVTLARKIQTERFTNREFSTNSEMTNSAIKEFCHLDKEGEDLLNTAVEKMKLSARSYFRVLKTARTIADLGGEKMISSLHIAEALQYRPRLDL